MYILGFQTDFNALQRASDNGLSTAGASLHARFQLSVPPRSGEWKLTIFLPAFPRGSYCEFVSFERGSPKTRSSQGHWGHQGSKEVLQQPRPAGANGRCGRVLAGHLGAYNCDEHVCGECQFGLPLGFGLSKNRGQTQYLEDTLVDRISFDHQLHEGVRNLRSGVHDQIRLFRSGFLSQVQVEWVIGGVRADLDLEA